MHWDKTACAFYTNELSVTLDLSHSEIVALNKYFNFIHSLKVHVIGSSSFRRGSFPVCLHFGKTNIRKLLLLPCWTGVKTIKSSVRLSILGFFKFFFPKCDDYISIYISLHLSEYKGI